MRRVSKGICVLVALMAAMHLAMADDKPAAQGTNDQEMMKKYMEMVAPGPQHEAMAKDVGKWTGAMKMWMDPAAPPQETTTVREAHMDMDGRYLIEDETATMMGMPYKGRSTVAYDKFRGEYLFFYYDNMSTAFMIGKGKLDPDGKSVTYTGTADDPMTNRKDTPFRMVITDTDGDHQTMQMYTTSPDGKEYKVMETAYTRVR